MSDIAAGAQQRDLQDKSITVCLAAWQLTELYADQWHFDVFILLCFAPNDDVKVLAVVTNILSTCKTRSDGQEMCTEHAHVTFADQWHGLRQHQLGDGVHEFAELLVEAVSVLREEVVVE